MKQYTGTKTVKAEPMTLGDYKAKTGRSVNERNGEKFSADTEGYLVEYPDGYQSWSPKDVFEAAYRVSETYVDRMRIELADLTEKINKATTYLFNESLNEDCMISGQLCHMRGYAVSLCQRIVSAEMKERKEDANG